MAVRWPTILKTAALAGTLDLISACLYYFIKTDDTRFYLILQFISTSVLGKSSYADGAPAAVLGLFLHYLVALGWTIIFFWLYPRLGMLRKNWFLSAFIYGCFVWVIMNGVIVPLSRVAHRNFDPVNASINIGILIVCIGIPVSWTAQRSRRRG